jgi:hypothetical protein
VETLQAMLQHRTIDLLQHIEPHFDPVVRRDTYDVAVERGVVELAQGEPVGNPSGL